MVEEMSKEEYLQELADLKKEYEEKRKELARRFCEGNNEYNIGDVVEDHIGKVRVESMYMDWAYHAKFPEMVYKGVELRKDGFQKKYRREREVWQSNLIEK